MAGGSSADLVVLGAGPAGLAAAHLAARRGLEVEVLERAEAVGGAAGSFEVAGLRVDHGSHRLHPATEPRVLAELRALLGDDLQIRPRRGRIRLAGRWVPFPLGPRSLAALPPELAIRAGRDALLAPLRRPRADTFAEVLRARLGPELCERFYFPYARKLWGLDPELISGEQARRRVGASSPARLVARVVRGARGATFYYPRRGFGQIPEALADAATAAGARLRLGCEALSVRSGEDAVAVETATGAVVEGAVVFSTIPLPALARIADAPPSVADAARSLRARALALVYLALERDRYGDHDAHYLPEPHTPATRVSEPKNYRESRADPRGITVLCAEIPCDPGDRIWSAPDDELAALARAALGEPVPEPLEIAVRRLPSAYPVYDLARAAALETVLGWVDGLPRVLTFGRQGLFVHDNTHHALAMAFAAVDTLTKAGVDLAAWARARAAFAAHVVED